MKTSLLSLIPVFAVSVAVAAPAKQPAKPAPAKPPVVKPVVLTPKEELYQSMGTTSIWTRDGQLDGSATSLRNLLLAAAEQGLDAGAYWTSSLERMYSAFDASMAARFETEATDALLKYSTELSTGRLADPTLLGDDVKMKRQPLVVSRVVNAMKTVIPDWRSSFESVAPQWPGYAKLKNTLARLKTLNADVDFPAIQIPPKDPKVGDKGPVFAAIKMRLRTLGYNVNETEAVYTKELQALVKQYAADHTLKSGTTLNRSSQFWQQISVPLGSRMQQIKLTMEKYRWLPAQPEQRYIFVNLAFEQLQARENGEVALAMKTINGRPARMSPTLRDKIVDVELNPNWTVPDRLIVEDKVPAILADPSFLERGGFQVFDRNGNRELSSWEVDWYRITKDYVPISIKQQPGLGNALGVMKFNLTNPYAIYLHDTNERNLFSETYRQLSSGCVRLERPFDLSAYLLRDHPQWNDRRKVEAELSTTQFADWGVRYKQYHIKLVQPVQVYLMNLTADVDDRGVVKFAGDYYEQDLRLYQALSSRR